MSRYSIASEFSASAELAYYILPRSEIDEATRMQSRVVELGSFGDRSYSVVVASPNGSVTYRLDLSSLDRPLVIDAVASGGLRSAHDTFFCEGGFDSPMPEHLPDHYRTIVAVETAPNGNSVVLEAQHARHDRPAS